MKHMNFDNLIPFIETQHGLSDSKFLNTSATLGSLSVQLRGIADSLPFWQIFTKRFLNGKADELNKKNAAYLIDAINRGEISYNEASAFLDKLIKG